MAVYVVKQTLCIVSDEYLDYLTGKFLALKVVSETICFPNFFFILVTIGLATILTWFQSLF
jgi:hypothetical protein